MTFEVFSVLAPRPYWILEYGNWILNINLDQLNLFQTLTFVFSIDFKIIIPFILRSLRLSSLQEFILKCTFDFYRQLSGSYHDYFKCTSPISIFYLTNNFLGMKVRNIFLFFLHWNEMKYRSTARNAVHMSNYFDLSSVLCCYIYSGYCVPDVCFVFCVSQLWFVVEFVYTLLSHTSDKLISRTWLASLSGIWLSVCTGLLMTSF